MSPRLAGDEPGYGFRLVNKYSGTITEHGFDLPSVTTILGETLGKPAGAMSWWGFRIGMAGIAEAIKDNEAVAELLEQDDPERLEAWLKTRGVHPNASLDSASSRGNFAHETLETLFAGEWDEATKRADQEKELQGTRYSQAVINWYHDRVLAKDPQWDAVHSELPLWSLRHGYAGTADLVLRHRESGELAIADLKTHKPARGFTKPGHGPAYVSDVVQMAAYRLAYHEMFGEDPTRTLVIIARENAQYLEDRRLVDPQVFLSLIDIYHAKQAFEGKGK